MSIRRYHTRSGERRYMVEWRLPGRVKRRRAFRTEKAARAFEAEVVASANRGEFFDPRRGNSVSVERVYESWLASRQDVSAKVRRGFVDNWRLSVEPAFGSWPVAKVDRASIQTWVNEMTVGPRTKRWRHSVLRMVLDHAVEEGLLARNPAARTSFPPLETPQHTFLTASEVDNLTRLCGTQGDVVTILAYTGLRWGELCGLNVADVDLAANRIRVRRSMSQVGGKLVSGATKSRAGTRSVPIPQRVVPLLSRRIEGRPADEPAIRSPRGAPLSRENWVRSVKWKQCTAAVGRPNLRIHDLRHTYASLARSAGADLRLLQKTMGHASITVTAHVYADLYDGELDAVAAAMDTFHIDPPDVPDEGAS